MKCQNTQVGNELIRGISGGERKRLNIGTEIVTDPSLIFLDEPTSGLDSFNAQSVMQMLLKLAQNARTIITTIHQPRSSIFQMFDSLMLLSEGRTMYFGPANDSIAYFTQLGFPCPPNYNPADYFMDVLSVDYRSPRLELVTRTRVRLLGDAFANKSVLGTGTDLKVASLAFSEQATEGNDASGSYASSWMTQFYHLIIRSWRSV